VAGFLAAGFLAAGLAAGFLAAGFLVAIFFSLKNGYFCEMYSYFFILSTTILISDKKKISL